MYVTIRAVIHQKHGEECHVNKTNSVLGLGMYFSYFMLFFKLFVDNYCVKRKDAPHLPRKPSASLNAVRKASEKAFNTVRKASERTLDHLVPDSHNDNTAWKAH